MTYQETSVSLPLELCPPIVVERPIGSGTYVRLSDDIRKSVVYLGYEKGAESEIEPAGTGFLVAMGEPAGCYIVTAAHVALKLEDAPFCVRLNQRYKLSDRDKKPQGRLAYVQDARWFYHPTDDTVDVAVMPYLVPEWADFQWLRSTSFISDYKLVTKNIGPGDFSYVVGLLPFMKGTKRNMPAVHTGHVVLMPEDEKVTVSNWRQKKKTPKEKTLLMDIDAYLVQATALPGSSGSPVFVRRSLDTRMLLPELEGNDIRVSIPGSLWFLGIWRGAWFGDPPKDVYPFFDNDKVPFGVGTVVPAIKVVEVLNHPDLRDMRAKALQAEREKFADVPLGAKEPELTGDEILRAALNTAPVQKKKPKANGSKRGRGGGVNSK